jgi:trehalose 6-phosphate synthase
MARWVRFLIVLVPGLLIVAWLVLGVAIRANRAWFERDAAERAELAVTGARRDLASHWTSTERNYIAGLLREIARDKRIMGAAACLPSGERLAATDNYPAGLDCASFAPDLSAQHEPGTRVRPVTRTMNVAGGPVHVSVVALDPRSHALGYIVVAQDFSLLDQLDRQTQLVVLLGFVAILAGAWIVMVMAIRLSRRDWVDQVRRLLHTGSVRPDFHPVLQDVRNLVHELAAEVQADGRAGSWTPDRLRNVLRTQLSGDSVIVVANREPYIHQRTRGGGIAVQRPASGLVTALEPVMRACSGVWVAHGSGSADRDMADRHGRLRVPPGDESYGLRRVWLTPEEERGYYYGFANEGLWPLCHVAHIRPVFRREDWDYYREVNRRFADVVCEEASSDDPIVLVQDYHFALAPRLIRERLPRATILAFWHIPWPNAERMAICPWSHDLLQGLLGSSILGFQTQLHCNNLLEAADRFLEARIDREQFGIVQEGRTTLVRAYPISIEWPSRIAAATPGPAACRAEIYRDLRLPGGVRLGVGVDRLDYTKGIEERLLAVERLLDQRPEFRGRFVFVQIAAPSRGAIDEYRAVALRVEELAARINARFGSDSWTPVVLRRAHHEPAEVFRYYRAADVCYVSSLHDGMNLVAKEFVAARDDEQGVLVLSSFTGASRELAEALVVNPYDVDEAAGALAAALTMPAQEQRVRMRAMRALIAHFNVYRWAGRMLTDAARLRARERLSDRLTSWPSLTQIVR